MARVVIDPDTAILIAAEEIVSDPSYALLAPTLLRSQVLDRLFKRVRSGELAESDGLAINARFAKLKIRFLGDAVMRRQAWAIADRKGLGTTELAEYIALTQLQADALATADANLIASAGGLVAIVDPKRLRTSRSGM
ncbi:MAG: type II toxin-antitoxin system VapC family toxin [Inquilinaceae bacterium]